MSTIYISATNRVDTEEYLKLWFIIRGIHNRCPLPSALPGPHGRCGCVSFPNSNIQNRRRRGALYSEFFVGPPDSAFTEERGVKHPRTAGCPHSAVTIYIVPMKPYITLRVDRGFHVLPIIKAPVSFLPAQRRKLRMIVLHLLPSAVRRARIDVV